MALRFGVGIFVLLSLVLLVIGLSGEQGPVGEDAPIPAMFAADPNELDQERALRGTAMLGMAVFGLGLALGGLRNRQRWAWLSLWYWPVFFVLHVIAFGTYVPDSPFAVLAIIGLVLTRPGNVTVLG